MADKVTVRLKLLADDKKKTNLLKTDTCMIAILKSSTLQDAIMCCVKEQSTIKTPSEVTTEHISDLSYMEEREGELCSIFYYIQHSLEALVDVGFKFGPFGCTFVATLSDQVLKKGPSEQSGPITCAFKKMMTSQNTMSYLEPEIQNIHLPFMGGQSDNNEASSNSVLEQLHDLNFDIQVQCLVRSYIKQLGFGYTNSTEEESLEKFVDLYSKTLQFVERYWKNLLVSEFPSIPKQHSNVQSLKLLKLTQRK